MPSLRQPGRPGGVSYRRGVNLGIRRVIEQLLDRFTGAAAAYSLRSLSSSTTNVVRVRRSSDNTEQDFTASEVSDGTLETFVGAGNTGFVTTWYDQSGNSNDMIQAVADSQPTLVDAGALVTESGKPTIKFPSSKNLTNANVSVYPVASIFSAKNMIVDGLNVAFLGADFSFYSWLGTVGVSLRDPFTNKFGDPLFYINNTLYQPEDNDEIGVIYNDANFHVESSVGADLSSWPVFRIGGSFSRGVSYQSEVIIYPSDQSSNRTDIEANIANHYGITLQGN